MEPTSVVCSGRARAWTGIAASLLALLASCRSPQAPPWEAEESWEGTRGRPPEWIEIGAGVFDLQQSANDPVDDAFGYQIGGGYDFLRGPVRAGFELGASAARHDVNVVAPPPDEDPALDVVLLSMGARLQADFGDLPFGAWVRGGFAWREETDRGSANLANDQNAVYFGAGLDWWYEPGASLGPFVMVVRGEEDDLEERVIGLAARFYLDE